MQKYREIVEADEKLKKEKEKKQREQEEVLFQADLQRAYDAEFNKEAIEERKMQDLKEVEDNIKNFEEK